MERTRMKTSVYASRLRARRAELQKQRDAAIKEYPAAVNKWKTELRDFMVRDVFKRLNAMTEREIRALREKHYGGILETLFDGKPQSPEYPDDKVIRKIDHELKGLALVGKPETYVDDDDIKTMFTDES